jgi:hypothetical protein
MSTDPPSRSTSIDDAVALARAQQELQMRWVLLATIVLTVLLGSTSTLIYGPPAVPWALVQGSWATLLGWLIRKLFS